MKEERLIVRIDKKEKAQLAKVAKADGRSMSNYVRHLIQIAIKENSK